MVVNIRMKRLDFRIEADLEDYLQVYLSHHLSLLGLNLLFIGRQIATPGGIVDLLAIDATGVVYIIELKLRQATASTTAQLLAYRRSIKQLTKQQLIRVAAAGGLHIDLLQAFQRHFGYPLPEGANRAQVLTVIAASIHPRTAESLLELRDMGYAIDAFCYSVRSDTFSLIPHVLEQNLKPYRQMLRRKRHGRSPFLAGNPMPRYTVRIDVRWFWLTYVDRFVSGLVTFKSVHELYVEWVRAQAPHGLRVLQQGLFGRALAIEAVASGEWARVFLPAGTTIDPFELLLNPPPSRSYRAAGYPMAGYQRMATSADPSGRP